jgi:hypothetical protein
MMGKAICVVLRSMSWPSNVALSSTLDLNTAFDELSYSRGGNMAYSDSTFNDVGDGANSFALGFGSCKSLLLSLILSAC